MIKSLLRRSAFTLIELIMVIVVFGILAMISADIFVKIYDNYILARITNTLETKTELALDQIARRLQYRIKQSTIGSMNHNGVTVGVDYDVLPDTNESFPVLEWIGYADEALKGLNGRPGWSGFVDLDSPNTGKATAGATTATVATPGSDLASATNIIASLSGSTVAAGGAKTPALIMEGYVGDFDVSEYGWHPDTNASHRYVLNIRDMNATTSVIRLDVPPEKVEIYEHYKMVWSAYAIVPKHGACDNGDPTPATDCTENNTCNLCLYYNYQPWNQLTYNDGAVSLLSDKVATFRFTQTGDVIRLKLCIAERSLYDNNISICKEKAVF